MTHKHLLLSSPCLTVAGSGTFPRLSGHIQRWGKSVSPLFSEVLLRTYHSSFQGKLFSHLNHFWYCNLAKIHCWLQAGKQIVIINGKIKQNHHHQNRALERVDVRLYQLERNNFRRMLILLSVCLVCKCANCFLTCQFDMAVLYLDCVSLNLFWGSRAKNIH